MSFPVIRDEILKLARLGCGGTPRNFLMWINRNSGKESLTISEVVAELQNLRDEGTLVEKKLHKHSDFYLNEETPYDQEYNYFVFSDNEYSALQFVRSRLEAFLGFHNVSEDLATDIIIASTEALENAVKYSDHNKIYIHYKTGYSDELPADLKKKVPAFYIEITNHTQDGTPHADLLNGQYDSGKITLMKGLKVMNQLFDFMDLSLDEKSRIVTLKGAKYL